MLETWVWSLGWEDPLEKGMATCSSILACGIPWTEEPGGLQSVGLQRVGHDWATNTQRPHTLINLLVWSLLSLKATSENLFHVDFLLHFFFFFFICSGFCHTLKWNSHGFTCVPHPYPPSHLPLHPLPLGFPSAPGPSACLMHPTWAGDLFHPR